MNSIKSKILFSFCLVVVIFTTLIVLVSIVNYNLVNQYKEINTRITYEQSLKDDVWSLIEVSYNSFNSNDYSLYYSKLENIRNTEKNLDLIFDTLKNSNQESYLWYRNLKNSLGVVINNIEVTKLKVSQTHDITGVSDSFQLATSNFEFVKQNITNLFIIELKNISEVTKSINETQNYLLKSVIIFISIIIILLIIFIFYLSKKITKPIIYLSEISKQISSGNLDVVIDENIVNESIETEKLAHAFNLMISNIKQKINDLDHTNKELDIKISEISESNINLENSQKATINLLEDVEEEKAKVENLANDLEKFKLAVENASDQIVITDSEGIVIYGNKAVLRITGYTPEEALGKKAGVLWKLPMPLPYYQNLWDVIKNKKQVFVNEIQNKRKSGDVYIALINISPVFNDNGDIIYYVAIERDITKEKEVDKAKTEFVSLASHQLRTPLSAINWYTEMLLAGDAGAINDEQRNYLNEVAIGNKRMVDLVDDLLNVSRLDMGTFIVESKPTDLRELMKSAIDENKSKIIEKKLKIEEKEEGDISEFPADEKLLRMVFQNLLSNAVKYTPPEGSVKVNIMKRNKGDIFGEKVLEEDSLVFSVEDSGMGIPSQQQDKIFQKLFRADNAKESETEGTGLGLYVIKSIIDKANGSIWFKSEQNKGTTFYVAFSSNGMKMKEK